MKAAKVLVVGVGGLGCPAAIALAHAGVSELGLIDDDVVESTNLHRQILFDERDVGTPKLDAAARALEQRAPNVARTLHHTRLLPHNAVEIVQQYDVVLEGSDNFATKFLAADACAIARVPIVHTAAVRWHGTVLAVSSAGKPCYRCVFEDVLPGSEAPSCETAGVVGPLVGLIGALGADRVVGIVQGRDVFGALTTFDATPHRTPRGGTFRRTTIAARASCPLCGERRIASIEPNRYTAGIACA